MGKSSPLNLMNICSKVRIGKVTLCFVDNELEIVLSYAINRLFAQFRDEIKYLSRKLSKVRTLIGGDVIASYEAYVAYLDLIHEYFTKLMDIDEVSASVAEIRIIKDYMEYLYKEIPFEDEDHELVDDEDEDHDLLKEALILVKAFRYDEVEYLKESIELIIYEALDEVSNINVISVIGALFKEVFKLLDKDVKSRNDVEPYTDMIINYIINKVFMNVGVYLILDAYSGSEE